MGKELSRVSQIGKVGAYPSGGGGELSGSLE